MGAFEITAQYASMQVPITVLYRPPRMSWLEPAMQQGRARGRVRLAPADVSGVRELMTALRRGEAVRHQMDAAMPRVSSHNQSTQRLPCRCGSIH